MGGTHKSKRAEMAVGKNKRLTKSSKKGGKKKNLDVFKNKHKYEVRSPSYFQKRNVGNTICTKTMGTRIASDSLKGRVFNVCLADLKDDEEQAHRIVRLRVEDVQDRRVLTNFYGIQLTTDKLRSLVRKWQTLIESNVDAKTTDGFVLRLFCIGFTSKRPNQAKKTHYAQASQIRQIRKKMIDIMRDQVTSSELKQVVEKLVHNVMEKQIETATRSVYPLTNIYIRKVKMLKAPKFDLNKLMEVHGDSSAPTEDVGAVAQDVEEDEPADPVVGETVVEA